MTVTRKAVILARGLGSRMRAGQGADDLTAEQRRVADLGVKGMITSAGRPFLDYVISGLADAGIREVCLVIGPEHDVVRDYYSSGVSQRVTVQFAEQAHALGTADAVAAAKSFAGADVFLVLNSDNCYPVEAIRALAQLNAPGLVGFDREALIAAGNIPAERVQRFALVETDDTGFLGAIHEKPDDDTFRRLAGRSVVSMNLWSFTPTIFEACRRVKPSVRGELELQDAVRIARDELGDRFRVVPFAGEVLDLSSRGDIGVVSERLRNVEVAL